MLKGISPILTPELLKIIAEMGHGDELVLADGNFPAASIGKRCVRMDGHGGAEVMAALMPLFPLDDFVPRQHRPHLGAFPAGGGHRPARRTHGENGA